MALTEFLERGPLSNSVKARSSITSKDCMDEELINRMWFSVVCTLIDNDTRHHSGQNVVDSRGAAE